MAIAGEDACCIVAGRSLSGYPPGATPDLAPSRSGASAAPDPSWEFPSMEFWRTDEIAPLVLIILIELMVLGLINYTMPI